FDGEVDALAQQMRKHPDNLEGWVLLGRSRKQQQRLEDARNAFEQARKLSPRDPDLMVELSEILSLADPQHRVQGKALDLLDQALAIDPRNQRALWFKGISQYQRQQFAEAAATWTPLLQLAPEQTRPALRKQIDEARAKANLPPLPPAGEQPPLLRVHVEISPALQSKLAASDVLFVLARQPDGPPIPLAVKRLAASVLPADVALADADGPMPTLRLSQQMTVTVLARISHSGDALPRAGDFESAPVNATVGADGSIRVMIDTIHGNAATTPAEPESGQYP
ncbi:MAG: tetratricopeptide repeat protein, partial [Lysobacteraceae bacterium]